MRRRLLFIIFTIKIFDILTIISIFADNNLKH